MMRTPLPRGPLSRWTQQTVTGSSDAVPAVPLGPPTVLSADPLRDEDLQLALWTLYELHYRGFGDALPDAQWDPELLAFRRLLEEPFEAAVRAAAGPLLTDASTQQGLVAQITSLVQNAPGPGLAAYVQRRCTLDEFGDFMRQRSIYHLKESDPQNFVLPGLAGPAKVALAELQYDEFGAGRPDRLHQVLFEQALDACGLDSTYGAYIDEAHATTLANTNVMSLFCLNRRLHGAALGHLAAFEATSSIPCRKVAQGIGRLGLPDGAAEYFDEHVEADAAHEQIAMRDICGAAVDSGQVDADDVLLGVAACLALDAIGATDTLARWESASTRPGAA